MAAHSKWVASVCARQVILKRRGGGAAVTTAAGGASAGHTRRCGEKTWAGSGGGYATIIQDLRVLGVTCARGLRIAGHSLDGHPPAAGTAGWPPSRSAASASAVW
jgi:hypothetical protein